MIQKNKKYYRLEEVADEWGCSIDEMLNYGEQEFLTISVKPYPDFLIRGFGYVHYCSIIDGRKKLKALEKVCFYGDENYLEPFPHGLFPIDISTIARTRYVLAKKINPSSTNTPDSFVFSSSSNLKDVSFWSGCFHKEDMFITAEEKIRFESGPKLPLDNRKKETYLKIISILLELVVGRDKELNNQGEIQKFINEKYGHLPGISKSNLISYFAEAKKAFKGDKKDS